MIYNGILQLIALVRLVISPRKITNLTHPQIALQACILYAHGLIVSNSVLHVNA